MKYTPNLNLRKPDKEDFYNVEDFNANCDILDDAVGSGSSNLLVNSDFNVNTNGQASYTGTADVETVTKWMSRSSDTTVTVTANGITVASGGSADAGIYQSVLPFAKYSDNEFVVTAYIGGEKYSAKGKAGSCEVVETDFTLAVEQMGTDVAVVIKVNATASINIENVALEVKGTFSPANYYDELGKSGYLVSNPNLLINPDFKINQRGDNTYAPIGQKYTVDRWKADNNCVVIPTSKGISLKFYIVQVVEDTAKLLGEYVTFSVKVSATNSEQIWLQLSDDGVSGIISRSFTGDGIHSITCKLPNSFTKGLAVIVGSSTGSFITVEWAKLELGGVATPFVPPLMAEELVKCQRYFRFYDRLILSQWDINNSYTQGVHNLSIQMRTKPTVSMQAYEIYADNGTSASVHLTVTTAVVTYTDEYRITVKFEHSGTTYPNRNIMLEKVGLDAEIY